ncbi:MAG: hypothetical protein ACE5JL_10665 [Dehalococcoidia bacterium]
MTGRRLIVLGGVWFAAVFLAIDRVNISLAAPRIIEELNLSGAQMGFILGMFFWGFLLANPLGGIACLGLALLLASGPFNSFIVLLMDVFPPDVFGTAFALVVGVGAGLCGAVAPVLVGHLLDLTGSFFWGFTIISLAGVLGAFLSVPLMFYERRVKASKAARVAGQAEAAHEALGMRH